MKKFLDKFISLGAAVVILGAWAKITHQPFADLALTIGLFMEAAIFICYMFISEGQQSQQTVVQVDHSLSADENAKTIREINGKIDRFLKGLRSI